MTWPKIRKLNFLHIKILIKNTQSDDLTMDRKFLNCTQIKTLPRLTPL